MNRQKVKTIIQEHISISAKTCLEVITVRIAEKAEWENALGFCKQVFQTVETVGRMNLNLYLSTGYSSDISVHIHSGYEPSRQEKSLLGLQLAKGLSAYGIVSHTLWIDQQIMGSKGK